MIITITQKVFKTNYLNVTTVGTGVLTAQFVVLSFIKKVFSDIWKVKADADKPTVSTMSLNSSDNKKYRDYIVNYGQRHRVDFRTLVLQNKRYV